MSVSGLDFPLTVAATAQSATHIFDFDDVRTNLVMLAARNDDIEPWKQNFTEVLKQENVKKDLLKFQCQCVAVNNYEKLAFQLRKSNLFLFPSKFDSLIFGTETLAAIATGVPVLVSEHPGIGLLFRSMLEERSLVRTKTEK